MLHSCAHRAVPACSDVSFTCHEAVGFRSHSVVAGQVLCRHRDVVDLTTLHAIQEAAGAGGVTGDRQALISHSLNRVRADALRCLPHHLGRTHIVVDREIRRGAGLWGEKGIT